MGKLSSLPVPFGGSASNGRSPALISAPQHTADADAFTAHCCSCQLCDKAVFTVKYPLLCSVQLLGIRACSGSGRDPSAF